MVRSSFPSTVQTWLLDITLSSSRLNPLNYRRPSNLGIKGSRRDPTAMHHVAMEATSEGCEKETSTNENCKDEIMKKTCKIDVRNGYSPIDRINQLHINW